ADGMNDLGKVVLHPRALARGEDDRGGSGVVGGGDHRRWASANGAVGRGLPRIQELADQDSNLDKQNQNLLCYRYTIGQRRSLLTRASILGRRDGPAPGPRTTFSRSTLPQPRRLPKQRPRHGWLGERHADRGGARATPGATQT